MTERTTMVECKSCGVFNDRRIRERCWKCQATLPTPPALPPIEEAG